jgi:hypothetical protein
MEGRKKGKEGGGRKQRRKEIRIEGERKTGREKKIKIMQTQKMQTKYKEASLQTLAELGSTHENQCQETRWGSDACLRQPWE